jgi:WD40 repeat protein
MSSPRRSRRQRPAGVGPCRVGDQTLRVWDLESGEEIATFTGEAHMTSCAITPDGQTIIAGDRKGRVHFLQLVETDQTKPPIGEAKIQRLRREQASSSLHK